MFLYGRNLVLCRLSCLLIIIITIIGRSPSRAARRQFCYSSTRNFIEEQRGATTAWKPYSYAILFLATHRIHLPYNNIKSTQNARKTYAFYNYVLYIYLYVNKSVCVCVLLLYFLFEEYG